jgi:ADP-ribosylation factor-like protein 13B
VAPTVGFSSVEFKFEKHMITLFDLGGGKRIRDIWKNYFSEVYGVVYVVDSSEPERLQECKGVLRNLLQDSKVAGKPVLV